jgi:hypothetical protein
MVIAALSIVVTWLSFGGLSVIPHWNVTEVEFQFGAAVIQYYTCSLLSIRPQEKGTVDMPAFYERQRPAIFAAFVAMMVMSMIQNYWDRDRTLGLTSTSWIGENAVVLVMLILIVVAGWAKPRWLQWAASLGTLAMALYFLSIYALPGG